MLHHLWTSCCKAGTCHISRTVAVIAAAIIILIAAPLAANAQQQADAQQQAADAPAPAVQVWNVNLLTVENKLSPPEEAVPLQPITIVAARNGWFSGKVMLQSKPAVTGLAASIGQLKSDSGQTIGPDRLQVRYGVQSDTPGYYKPAGFDVLLESPPEEITQAAIWVTVHVPADAPAETYSGVLKISPGPHAANIEVPVQLKVVEWTLPDTQDWRTWIELVQSTDTTAVEYNLDLWSDDHWKQIERTFGYINRIGSRVVALPVICHTNYGNAESLIRWIPTEDGGWEHDFSRFDRYLDTAIKHMGKPKVVVIYAWDIYLNPPEGEIVPEEELPDRIRNHSYFLAVERMKNARRALRGKGPAVTVATDAEKNETDTLYLPPYEDEQSLELWKPVWEGIRDRLSKRGLLDVAVIGSLTDTWPTKQQAQALHDISGGLPWASNAHWSSVRRKGGKVHGIADVAYETNVWDQTVTVNPAVDRTYGWQRPEHVAAHYRLSTLNRMLPSTIRTQLEVEITGQQRGMGRIGADFWWAVRSPRGERKGTVTSRYRQSQWRNLDISSCILAPSPEGAVATARYEYLREGAQDTEARILIEQALLDEAARAKLGDDLAKRAQELLDARQKVLWQARGVSEEQMTELGTVTNPGRTIKSDLGKGQTWFTQSSWQARSEDLFRMAAEVQSKLK